MISIIIDNKQLNVAEGTTILQAARDAGITIPTLCYLEGINDIGACRLCIVEVEGQTRLVPSCNTKAEDGMVIRTNTEKVRNARRLNAEMILSQHHCECTTCVRSGNCELQQMCKAYGVTEENKFVGEMLECEIDTSAAHMIRDNSKCVLCRRCVAVCEKVQGIGVIGANGRGFGTYIGSPFDMGLGETSCVSCGQCIAVCPTGALAEKDYIDEVLAAIDDPEKYVCVQTAPAVRAALGEEFGYPMGTDVEGKMAAALRRIGFNKVFDTDFSADLTIMEEANELLARIKDIRSSEKIFWRKVLDIYATSIDYDPKNKLSIEFFSLNPLATKLKKLIFD